MCISHFFSKYEPGIHSCNKNSVVEVYVRTCQLIFLLITPPKYPFTLVNIPCHFKYFQIIFLHKGFKPAHNTHFKILNNHRLCSFS